MRMIEQRRIPVAMARSLSTAALCLFGALAVGNDTSDTKAVAEVTQLERHLEALYNSPDFARDPAVALAYYDPSASFLMFDIMEPTEFRGETFRRHFIDIGSQFEGGKVEFLELEVTADNNLAFATSLQHFAGNTKDGNHYDMTMRVTDCLHKVAGHWLIAHEHTSLPMTPAMFTSTIASKK